MPKKIIVGCDGTWFNSNEGFDQTSFMPWASTKKGKIVTPSNVTRICRALLPKSTIPYKQGKTNSDHYQVVCYKAGIASSDNFWDRYVTATTASTILDNIREAYSVVVEHYEHGDEIYLIGFSRGSFTVRSTAALINAIGILTKKGMEHYYDIIEDWAHQDDPLGTWTNWSHGMDYQKSDYVGKSYKLSESERYSSYASQLANDGFTNLDVPIKAVACWDTVGSMGIPPFHFLNPIMRKFEWLINGIMHKFDTTQRLRFINHDVLPNVAHCFHALALDESRDSFAPTLWEIPISRDKEKNPIVLKQCWFPGIHGDIGGGVNDENLPMLSLMWMVGQLQELGLDFDQDYLKWCRQQAHERKQAALARMRDGVTALAQPDTKDLYPLHARTLTSQRTQPIHAKRRLASLTRRFTGWSLGGLYDTYAGSGSFYLMGGIQARVVRPTSLGETKEFIHPSVRTRRAVSHLHPSAVAAAECDGHFEVPPEKVNAETQSTTDRPSPNDHLHYHHPANHCTSSVHTRIFNTAPLYAPWNLMKPATPPQAKLNGHTPSRSSSTNDKVAKELERLASQAYYDPPALDNFRLVHRPDPITSVNITSTPSKTTTISSTEERLRNWDAQGNEIMSAEWDPRTTNWRWVEVGEGQSRREVEEWVLTEVERELVEELGLPCDGEE